MAQLVLGCFDVLGFDHDVADDAAVLRLDLEDEFATGSDGVCSKKPRDADGEKGSTMHGCSLMAETVAASRGSCFR